MRIRSIPNIIINSGSMASRLVGPLASVIVVPMSLVVSTSSHEQAR